jgi:hypothetical protein
VIQCSGNVLPKQDRVAAPLDADLQLLHDDTAGMHVTCSHVACKRDFGHVNW